MQDLLIVEDNKLFQRLILDCLRGFSGGLRIAMDQDEANNHFSERKPNMLISDLHMPVGTTEGFLQKVSESDLERVLILSSDHDLLRKLESEYKHLGWEFACKNDKAWLSKTREFLKGVEHPISGSEADGLGD